MFSRILIKLIDEAIIPAITLVAVRFLSIIFLAESYDIPYSLSTSGFTYESKADFIFINSYSTIAMVGALVIGLTYVLLKAHFFHDSHVSPQVSAKLSGLRLTSFIQNSFDIYSQGSIWWFYLLLMVIVSGVMYYFGIVYSWVLWITLAATVVSTYLFLIDVEEEVKLSKDSSDDLEDADETVLEMGV